MPRSAAAGAPVAPAAPLVSSAGWSRALEEADAVIRTPLALSRRVGVVATEPGSGTTTVSAALVGLLARRRRGAVLGVDAGGGALAGRTGLPTEGVGEGEQLRWSDLTRAGESWAAPVERWRTEVAPVTRFADLVVTDWGTRPWAADLVDAAASGNVAVLVARADRRAALEAAASLALLPQTVRPVLVLVHVDRSADRLRGRLGERLDSPVLTLGHDPGLASAGALDGRRLRAGTRRELIAIGRAAVEQAVLSARPGSA